MKSIWRHDVSLHSKCFRAIAVLTQLAMKKGEILWQIDYFDPDL